MHDSDRLSSTTENNGNCNCSDVELVVWKKWGTGPFLMQSSDKVLFNPYTQNQVFSIKSYQTYVVTTTWLMTMAEW